MASRGRSRRRRPGLNTRCRRPTTHAHPPEHKHPPQPPGDDTGNWGAGRAGWITKLNVYADAKCVTGIKPTYGYDANNAKLLGREVGRGKDLRIWPASGEFITKIDIAAGK